MPLSPLLRDYEQVLLDLDGCVWVGEEATAGAVEAITELRAAGIGVAFVTNDVRRSGEELVRKLWALGIQASPGEMFTAGGALQHVLAQRHAGAGAVVIGSAAVHRHVRLAGLRVLDGRFAVSAEVAVVAGHDDFDYGELRDVTLAVNAGAALFATSEDSTYPMPDGLWPGTGAILAAVQTATGRRAECVGKPGPQLFQAAIEHLGQGRTLVVGDRLDADLSAAAAAGLDAAIVLTGATDRAQALDAANPAPVAIADRLSELVLA